MNTLAAAVFAATLFSTAAMAQDTSAVDAAVASPTAHREAETAKAHRG